MKPRDRRLAARAPYLESPDLAAIVSRRLRRFDDGPVELDFEPPDDDTRSPEHLRRPDIWRFR